MVIAKDDSNRTSKQQEKAWDWHRFDRNTWKDLDTDADLSEKSKST